MLNLKILHIHYLLSSLHFLALFGFNEAYTKSLSPLTMPSLSIPKKREPPKPLAKALTLFSQLLGFLSSSITLKSYAVHFAIRVFNPILYKFSFYLAKVLIFIESRASLWRFARILSKFYLKTHLLESKSCVN